MGGQDGDDDTTSPRLDKGKGRATEPHQQAEPGIVDDLIAGWIGGAVGILASQLHFSQNSCYSHNGEDTCDNGR